MGSNLLTRLFYSNLNRFAMEFTRVGIFCIGGGLFPDSSQTCKCFVIFSLTEIKLLIN